MQVLASFNLDPVNHPVKPLGNGLINDTWIAENQRTGDMYVLQRINHNIFKSPRDIDHNINLASRFLKKNHPSYRFTDPLPAVNGETIVQAQDGWYRMFNFISGSHAINTVSTSEQAFEAARLFGELTKNLSDLNPDHMKITLPDFHNLPLRYQQFKISIAIESERKTVAEQDIKFLVSQQEIVANYKRAIPHFKKRITHHDTKISNILFDKNDKGICVIDLDTMMPGYYISDVGDMMRTYLCPVDENEGKYDLVQIRPGFYESIWNGYMSEMGDLLSMAEKDMFHFSGQYMIYMQALRFLTDYLNNDAYYQTDYDDHNLVRARNQITLLQRYNELI